MADGAYCFGDFSMFPADRRLLRGSAREALPPKTFDALHLLVRNHSTLVTRTELIRHLWPDVHVTEANLTNIIVQLRKLMGRESIQTVSKYGYRFMLPVTGEPGVKQATYSAFVRARELLNQRTMESIDRARDLFWVCLADDPNFAPAWAWLGRTSRLMDKFKGQEESRSSLAELAFRRAFLLDPDLACAHQFYTQLQIDSGRGGEAMLRLSARIAQRGEEPETLAGLVQVLRVCGLLDESVAAHERAVALDPTVKTSVAHTHFLRGEYARVFETYSNNQFYLDAAAWAALGSPERAIALLRARLTRPDLGSVMSGLMASLLAVLEGRNEDAVAIVNGHPVFQEPEVKFYLARHCGMFQALDPTVAMLRQAREEGFHCFVALQHDQAFAGLRGEPRFQLELQEAARLRAKAEEFFHHNLATSLSKEPKLRGRFFDSRQREPIA
jgi:DNA-binding winged helix-turn-helix (wHTH) protein